MIDRLGNIINRDGVIIFYVNELDANGEIPYPFNESLRKPHMENMDGTKYSLNDVEIMRGNNIGVTKKLLKWKENLKREKRKN